MTIRTRRRIRTHLACGLFFLSVSGEIDRARQVPEVGGRTATTARGTSVILGQVVEAGTTRPVAGVTVVIAGAPAGLANVGVGDAIPMDRLISMDLTSMLSGVQQTLTDGQGRFLFTRMAKGTYSIQATKPGWAASGFGQLRPDSQPMPLVLGDGETLGNASLQLWKYSVLSGTVHDEAGEPIVGLGVRALQRTWIAGRPRLVTAGAAQTDDRGMYRISSLVPGDYVAAIPQIIVSSPAGGAGPSRNDFGEIQALISNRGASADPSTLMSLLTSLGTSSAGGIRVGDWIMQTSAVGSRTIPPIGVGGGRMLAYQTTFFPASTSPSQATTVTLASGDDRGGLDFQLKPVEVVTLSGSVTTPDGAAAGLPVRLVPSGAEEFSTDAGFETATTTTNGSGGFMFLAVPPGQYTIRVLRIPPLTPVSPAVRPDVSVIQNASGGVATSMGSMAMDRLVPAAPAIPSAPTLWATMPVSVADADVTGFVVPLRPGFRVTGRLVFEGTGAPPALSQFRRVTVWLDRAGGGTAGQAAASASSGSRGDGGQFDDNGMFATYGLVPGKYFVRVPFSVNGWALKSAILGGRDLSDVPLTVENGDVAGVTLTFTDRTSELSGMVRNDQAASDAESSVLVFPADPSTWIDFGSSPRRIRTTRTSQEGRYRLTGLPPGDYLAVAVRGDVGGNWQNPAYLERVSRTAIKVTIVEGEKKAQDLRISR